MKEAFIEHVSILTYCFLFCSQFQKMEKGIHVIMDVELLYSIYNRLNRVNYFGGRQIAYFKSWLQL